jgi:outer membrane receptor protein involved in Fe transport
LASGYRPGGTNGQVVPDPAIPLTYGPDKTYNYELGLKGEFLDRKLSFDTSLYYIDWSDVQITLQAPTTSYISNTGRAKSQGIEFSIESKPLQGLTIASWLTWADAALKEGFPANSPTQGNAGDRLPYSSRFSGNLSVDEELPITGAFKGFVGGAVDYVGDRLGEFAPTGPPRQDYPGYSQTNLHAGIRFDTWTLRAYATNVWDKRALLGGGLGSYPPFGFTFIQPRTVGLSIVKTF